MKRETRGVLGRIDDALEATPLRMCALCVNTVARPGSSLCTACDESLSDEASLEAHADVYLADTAEEPADFASWDEAADAHANMPNPPLFRRQTLHHGFGAADAARAAGR